MSPTGEQLRTRLGAAGQIPLYELLDFRPGFRPPRSREDIETEQAVSHARDIRVDEFEQFGEVECPRTYRVVLSCVRELNASTLQRLISLGQSAAAAEDDAE